MKAAAAILAATLALPYAALAHTIPDDLAIQVWAKPEGGHLHVLVRVPMTALADTIFPLREGADLDLPRVEAMLPDAAKTWISDWIDLYEDGLLLPKPAIAESRLALGFDNSFANYDTAWAHLNGPRLPPSVELSANQAMVDVLLDYPIRSVSSRFAIHSRLARLAVRVVTLLRFVSADGAMRTYGFVGDPGVFRLDPSWGDAVARFLPLGLTQVWAGADYWLFLSCLALLLRQPRALIRFVAVFGAAFPITLIAPAYGFAPEAVWFPVLFETLIALSIVYVALDVIVARAAGGTGVSVGPTIACVLGLVFGFGFSFGLRPALQFGGSHTLASIMAYTGGMELGQMLLLALLAAGLNLAFRLGLPERVGTIFLAALAAHTGWHRMLDRAQWVAAAGLGVAQIPWIWWITGGLGLAALGYLVYKTRAWRITTSDFSRIRRATS